MNVARRSHQGSANCSEECTVAFHVATTTVAETATLPAPDGPNLAIGSSIAGSVSEKNRSHLAKHQVSFETAKLVFDDHIGAEHPGSIRW